MERVLIIGSGPACVGAALAFVNAGVRPLVVDIGARLERELLTAVERMRATPPPGWSSDDRTAVTRQPIESLVAGLPEKRAFGSDFPFRDHGQLTGIVARPGSHRSVVSAAFGGYSNVWGAQITTFAPSTFTDWPVSFDDMEPHYDAVLQVVPYAAADDDLSLHLPLIAKPQPLPPASERSSKVLEAYGRHRAYLQKHGIVMGGARLAMSSASCVRCGLCMTGCPYGLIYSASHTLDQLCSEGKIEYRSGLMAVRLEELDGPPRALFRDQTDGSTLVIEAEKILVACGAMGTTRLVAGSLGLCDRDILANETAQFTLPLVSLHATNDPRYTDDFTLNQFNMIVESGPRPSDLSQVHFYTYNPAFLDALPARLRQPRWDVFTGQVLRRLSVAIGYLPSWASPQLRLRFSRGAAGELPEMVIARDEPRWRSNPMFHRVIAALLRAAPRIDLWPALPRLILAAGAKTYHFGSTFPHRSAGMASTTSTDRLGRLPSWSNIHLIDGSVFPTVPATTFTLTIMANAHRIASELAGSPT